MRRTAGLPVQVLLAARRQAADVGKEALVLGERRPQVVIEVELTLGELRAAFAIATDPDPFEGLEEVIVLIVVDERVRAVVVGALEAADRLHGVASHTRYIRYISQVADDDRLHLETCAATVSRIRYIRYIRYTRYIRYIRHTRDAVAVTKVCSEPQMQRAGYARVTSL